MWPLKNQLSVEHLLDQMFEGAYSPMKEPPSERCKQLKKQLTFYTDRIVEAMGMNFMDELLYASADLTHQLPKEAFREGGRFRLYRDLWEA